MRVESLHAVPAHQRTAQILLLPGVAQRAADFERAGMIETLRRQAPWVQLSLISPELKHLNDRDWLASLQHHVQSLSAPIWLGGISLGAFMALRFVAQYPSRVQGLCLIAPYLGSRPIAAEIERRGGLEHWHQPPVDDDDDERRIWNQVRTLGRPAPQVFLGLGRDDRFADSQRVLARALPAACTCTLPGGHDWPVWRQLWENFLDQSLDGSTPAKGVSR